MKNSLGLVLFFFLLSSCLHPLYLANEPERESSSDKSIVYMSSLFRGETEPPKFFKGDNSLKSMGQKWFFGRGLGKTSLNVTGVLLFSPYGIYLLANTGIELLGFRGVYITDLLPEDSRRYVQNAYGVVCDVPGRFTAFVAGVNFEESRKIDDD